MKSVLSLFRKIRQPIVKINSSLSLSAYRGGVAGRRTEYEYNKYVHVPPQNTAILAGREWLPGAKNDNSEYPPYLRSPKENLPAVYICKDSESSQSNLQVLAKEARTIFDDKLHQHGAILFRNLPLPNGATFSYFINELGYTMMGYEGGTSLRHKTDKHVFTASDDPSSYCIEAHDELSYSSLYPLKVRIPLQSIPLAV
ncbi:uncharacterized protein LOC144433010 [Glandiceps talaboti]